jgi:hypothetical protein
MVSKSQLGTAMALGSSNFYRNTFVVLFSVLVAAVVFYLLAPVIKDMIDTMDPNARQVREAVARASDLCGVDKDSASSRKITSILEKKDLKSGTSGETTIEESQRYFRVAMSEAGQLKLRDASRDCMPRRYAEVLNDLRAARNSDVTSYPEREPNSSTNQAGPPEDGVKSADTHYVYYEEKGRQPTTQGPFKAPGAIEAKPFADVATGDILKATRSFNFRIQPGQNGEYLATKQRGTCVKVVMKGDAVDTQEADSGGWLSVKTVNCPTSPTPTSR